MAAPSQDDPLDFVPFDDVVDHGDPSNWVYRGPKPGSGLPATSPNAPPGTLKIYEIYEDEFGDEIELHYFRHPDGTVGDVKVRPRTRDTDAMNEKVLSDVVEKLRGGKADLNDAVLLSGLSAGEVADFLVAQFPYRLQERQLRAHRELTLARSLQFLSRPILPGAFLLATVSKPVYRPCLFFTAEGDQATGLTWRAFQTLQPSRKDGQRAIRMTTGPGCGLHRTIDGWVSETLPKKTVVLTEDFLRSRGWQSGTQNFVFAGS